MSLKFDWNFLDIADLRKRCENAVTESIAQTPRPPVIAEPIRATRLDFGTTPPDISFESVQSVSFKRTHITFSLKYKGDASLTLETAIQANQLREPFNDPQFNSFTKPLVAGALASLVLPFRLVLQNVILDSVIDFVYTTEGAIIYFREDPIKHVDNVSSLDMIPGVKNLINSLLKEELLTAFYEDIPESVWATTNPIHTLPDPFFGIDRWSQIHRVQTRWSSLSLTSIASPVDHIYKPFATLSLCPQPYTLQLPNAIISRSLISKLQNYDYLETNGIESESRGDWRQFVHDTQLNMNDSASVRSVSSSMSSTKKPRRRVISLNMFSPQKNKNKNIDKDKNVLNELDIEVPDLNLTTSPPPEDTFQPLPRSTTPPPPPPPHTQQTYTPRALHASHAPPTHNQASTPVLIVPTNERTRRFTSPTKPRTLNTNFRRRTTSMQPSRPRRPSSSHRSTSTNSPFL